LEIDCVEDIEEKKEELKKIFSILKQKYPPSPFISPPTENID